MASGPASDSPTSTASDSPTATGGTGSPTVDDLGAATSVKASCTMILAVLVSMLI